MKRPLGLLTALLIVTALLCLAVLEIVLSLDTARSGQSDFNIYNLQSVRDRASVVADTLKPFAIGLGMAALSLIWALFEWQRARKGSAE